jgi:hypothetical protein
MGVAWGKLSAPAAIAQLDIRHENRFLNWDFNARQPSLTVKQVNACLTNLHVIPASDDIAQRLNEVPVGAVVSLKGELVDARAMNGAQFWDWKSSTARDDVGEGACEVIHVREVKWRLPSGVK